MKYTGKTRHTVRKIWDNLDQPLEDRYKGKIPGVERVSFESSLINFCNHVKPYIPEMLSYCLGGAIILEAIFPGETRQLYNDIRLGALGALSLLNGLNCRRLRKDYMEAMKKDKKNTKDYK